VSHHSFNVPLREYLESKNCLKRIWKASRATESFKNQSWERIENGFRKDEENFEEFSSGSPGGKILGVRVGNYGIT
jgi:hypothetical protein